MSTVNQRWVTALALKTLADMVKRTGDDFTASQLATWMGDTVTKEQRVHATSRLCALGFVKHQAEVILGERVNVYTVTPEGSAAIEAARQGHVRMSGPKGTRAPNPVDQKALVTRLWNLMRVRRMLDSKSAATTLCNAGDDFEKARASIRKYLRRWADCGAVAESARRIGAQGRSNGDKRFVLLVDSPEPPRWRQAAKGQQ